MLAKAAPLEAQTLFCDETSHTAGGSKPNSQTTIMRTKCGKFVCSPQATAVGGEVVSSLQKVLWMVYCARERTTAQRLAASASAMQTTPQSIHSTGSHRQYKGAVLQTSGQSFGT
mmetsp:Transcript_60159/g.135376  ORF Transcript_60159/g.135376 Transcript_60159/m.135376 type:complete len:115 (+) Transcript_60159:75-419(+)